VAAALGDTAEQARTLDKMFELAGTDSEPTPQQVDALYRLAEIFIGSNTRRKQGVDLLERAFAAEPRWAQAGRLLKQAAAQARDLTYEVAPLADRAEIDGLAMRIATRALAHRKIDLAADVYEFLRERSPADRAVWQPLLTIYRELGDGDRLGSVISSTLPN